MLRTVVEKIRNRGLWSVARALLPTKVDMLVYVGDIDTVNGPPIEGALDVTVERYDSSRRSGHPAIDERLVGRREVYAVFIAGKVAHIVSLTREILLPRQFGLDQLAPVIDDGLTIPEFRGKRLQPLVRRAVVADVIARGVHERVYGTVAPHNFRSQRGNERGGMKRLARVQGYRVLGLIMFKKVLGPEAWPVEPSKDGRQEGGSG